tara:strand:- start:2846 stop:3337 length:492 start_codon:yes stop_codon:yes gene_type:complete
MPGRGVYEKIIKGIKRDISTLSRIRANPSYTAGVKPTAAQQSAQRDAENKAKVPGTNTRSTARGYKGRNPPLGSVDMNFYIKPKKAKVLGAGPILGIGGSTISYPENQDSGRKPARPTIKYPEERTIAVKRVPAPANTGHGGATGPKPSIKPRFEAKFERENR